MYRLLLLGALTWAALEYNKRRAPSVYYVGQAPTQNTATPGYKPVARQPQPVINYWEILTRGLDMPEITQAPESKKPAQTAPATIPRKWITPKAGQAYEQLFNDLSHKYNMPDGMLSRLIYQESRYNKLAWNKASNAQGIAQIVPRWHPNVDPWKPEQAIPYAAKYLSDLRNMTGSWPKAMAAYNWGIGNLRKYGKPNSADWLKYLPVETYKYVTEICRDTGIPL